MKCEDIQAVLFDYMNHELGDGRSELVTQHLKNCPDCKAAAKDISDTLDFLKDTSKEESNIPKHLTDKHRARLFWSLTHPVLDWIYTYHIIVSILITLLLIYVSFLYLRTVRYMNERDPDPGIEVTIGVSPAQNPPSQKQSQRP